MKCIYCVHSLTHSLIQRGKQGNSRNYPPKSSYKTSIEHPFPVSPIRRISIVSNSLSLSKSSVTELANSQEALEDSSNKSVVLQLYHALSSRDVETVHKLLAPDLEWWFHGPPSHQYMMRLLTGIDADDAHSFEFVPHSVDAFGSTVIVEGCDQDRDIFWIHAWTVNSHGIITQVREYFNTSLTVTRFGSNTSSAKSVSITSLHCPSVWESTLSNRVGKSVPGLVLAI